MVAAPHEITDQDKVDAITAALRDGRALPPVVVLGGGQALTGTHRLAAYAELGLDPVTIEVTDEDYLAAIEHLGHGADDPPAWDELDLDDLVRAIHQTTDDPGLKLATADQY